MADFIQVIPAILAYFVPGYFACHIFERFAILTDDHTDKIEGNGIIPCIVISFISTTFTRLLFPDIGNTKLSVISTGIAILGSLTLTLLFRSKVVKKIYEKTTRTSIYQSIWHDVLMSKKGKQIRFYTEFNYQEARVEGIVSTYEPQKDGECRIAISDYTIYYPDNTLYKPTEALFVISSKDVYNMEIFNCRQNEKGKKQQ